ncbi:siderophore-interacting protein [Streptomyces sp. NPDC005408]|uniref:siderophore-interacting protein n=1 Tax=Streptomyces sp. NPDC005408 TaxID=3155341 RepID=UPI0033BE605A
MEQRLPVRFLRVVRTGRLTPHMVRITFGGPDLADFVLDGPDQQVKLYFPRPGRNAPLLPAVQEADGDVMRWYEAYSAIPEGERPWMRSYTVRGHDPARATIDVDFVLHDDAGPATRWARSASPGDTLGMYGPSAYFSRPVVLGRTDWMLMAGDEAALPAIGTLLEALPRGARAVAYIEVAEASDEQALATDGDVTVHWLHRDPARAGHGERLIEAVRSADFAPGSVCAWLGGEAGAVRALRRHLVDERGIGKREIDFAGYWRRSLTQDDAPTPEDLAEAQERLADAQTQGQSGG